MQPQKATRLLAASILLAISAAGFVFADNVAPANVATEGAYLDILPKIALPDDVKPIQGAVNEEFRNCRAQWPAEYAISQKGPEARAFRDIYGFIKVKSVIETQDCSCSAKVANWVDVEALAANLRKTKNIERLSWQETKVVFETSNDLFPVAETMCGGSF